eukprot:TRINITY_DN50875_c0_g1_i1.p1 TRINITY_DN50875_c0_g1~~TRINITY_DN50875_c0_g1_i1.p1  ORF type:complete len:154 (-),score=41.92 TRINITY_DN50875_c0_g1_i1:154-615(-)
MACPSSMPVLVAAVASLGVDGDNEKVQRSKDASDAETASTVDSDEADCDALRSRSVSSSSASSFASSVQTTVSGTGSSSIADASAEGWQAVSQRLARVLAVVVNADEEDEDADWSGVVSPGHSACADFQTWGCVSKRVAAALARIAEEDIDSE